MQKFKKLLALSFCLVVLTAFFSCSKDDDNSSGNADEAAAARVVGTYKGTIDNFSTQYFDATIIVTKESGNRVKIAPKSGEVYSGVTAKIMVIQAIPTTDNATAQDPNGTLLYDNSQKTITLITKQTAASDVIFHFEGTKQ
ncbi:hypothetical protein D3C87_314430 [compost metagenome]|uniref:Lipocalin-like domain-containing protein n=1 Tax=Pedobacter xixiisoli TaxID=1476464 RepID=A0A286ACH2_9SPHI|nr:hypothetical protein [Pedobacter xixiisoli]SOD19610.1 hypothetical protein SAMN06297358_3314 [Pedobacter xixiisoli]